MKSLKLRPKLFIAFLSLGLFATVATAWLYHSHEKRHHTDEAFARVTAIRETQKERIESYFKEKRTLLQCLARDRSVVAAVRSFGEAVDNLRATPEQLAGYREELERYYEKDYLARIKAITGEEPDLKRYLPVNARAIILQRNFIVRNHHPVGEKANLIVSGDGSEYARLHAVYHPRLSKALRQAGFYDLFLIDDKTGRVVYTNVKEPDFGTSMIDGPYRDSGVARVFRKALESAESDTVSVTDFSFYAPSLGAPSAFMSAPIYDGDIRVGIVAVQLPISQIDAIMTGGRSWKDAGYGESGEGYLIGDDYKMRSNSRFLLENIEGYLALQEKVGVDKKTIDMMRAYSSSILLQEVRSEAAKRVLTDASGTVITPDYRGIPVMSSYTLLNIEGLHWHLLTEIDVEEVFRDVNETGRQALFIAFAIGLIAFGVAYLLAQRLTRPIDQLIENSRELGKGNLALRVPVSTADEIGELAASFNEMAANLETTTVSKDYFNDIVTNMTDLLIVVSVEFKETSGHASVAEIKTVNSAACAMLGYNDGELIGLPVESLFRVKDDARWFYGDGFRELLRIGAIKSEEKEYLRKDGSVLPVLFSAKPMTTCGDNICLVVTIAQDITGLKHSRERMLYIDRLLRAIMAINNLITREKDERMLLQRACGILTVIKEYKMVWAGIVEKDHKRVVPVAHSGFDDGYLDTIAVTWDDQPTGMGPSGMAIKTRRMTVMQDILNEPRFAPWRDAAIARGYRSSISLPLFVDGEKVYGVLNVYSVNEAAFVGEELDLLGQVAQDLSYALTAIRVDIRQKEAEEALRKSEAGLAKAQEMARLGSWEMDIASGRIECSMEAGRILGRPAYENTLDVHDFQEMIHPDDRNSAGKVLFDALCGHKPYIVDYRLLSRDNKERVVHAQAEIVRGEDGRPQKMVGTIQDVTEIRWYQSQTKLATEVFENTIEGVIVTNQDATIEFVNKAFTTITGYTPEEAIGENPRILQSERHDHLFYEKMWEALRTEGKWHGEIWNRRKSGEAYPEVLNITAIRDPGGKASKYVGVFQDISYLRWTEEQLKFHADNDALTGLPNREAFRDRIDVLLRTSEQADTLHALVFIGLDRLHTINESLGHITGDAVLQGVAKRLRESSAHEKAACRYSGDEFAVMLEGLSDTQEAVRAANTIMETLAAPFRIKGQELHIGASIGIAFFPSDGRDTDTLIKNADSAMRRAKEEGGKRYLLYSEKMNEQAFQKLQLENDIRRGLNEEEFVLHYQPKVDIESGRIIGVEGLVRWRHPVKGMVSPGLFIPVAEGAGLIGQLGESVLRQGCAQAKRWYDGGFRDISVAVNLSTSQFHAQDVVKLVETTLADTGLPPEMLGLEITESLVMKDVQGSIRIMERLKDMGIKLYIDDFGTGYSSLSYLRHFPIYGLKIDQSFVRDITT
ncbi:MAG: EAL domain-containing protein, partial [Nitrospirota bacterium]|nr:EAL domain-containing protein [Nitrospirota bacterium]